MTEPSNPHLNRHIGNRRRSSWWEPIFNPQLKLPETPYDWDIERDSGPNKRFVSGRDLANISPDGEIFTVSGKTFHQCDLQGEFFGKPILIFDECKFIDCDFAYSRWTAVHFKKCTFSKTSLSLAYFNNCEFRGSIWRSIGVASRTEFNNTFIDKPEKLISATISNTNPNDSSKFHKEYQKSRLLSTRAHVLRNILNSHVQTGEESVYYNTLKHHELSKCYANISKNWSNIVHARKGAKTQRSIKLLLSILDLLFIRILGTINSWGESVSRPFIFLASSTLLFSLIYKYVPGIDGKEAPIQRSFDISILAGYTAHNSSNLIS